MVVVSTVALQAVAPIHFRVAFTVWLTIGALHGMVGLQVGRVGASVNVPVTRNVVGAGEGLGPGLTGGLTVAELPDPAFVVELGLLLAPEEAVAGRVT